MAVYIALQFNGLIFSTWCLLEVSNAKFGPRNSWIEDTFYVKPAFYVAEVLPSSPKPDTYFVLYDASSVRCEGSVIGRDVTCKLKKYF